LSHREPRERLSHWGHDLRRSWATIAQAAGVDDYESRVLMNHTISNVHDRYKVRGALVHHLREVQERVSAEILLWCGVRAERRRRLPEHSVRETAGQTALQTHEVSYEVARRARRFLGLLFLTIS
jgi:hypothetical protein